MASKQVAEGIWIDTGKLPTGEAATFEQFVTEAIDMLDGCAIGKEFLGEFKHAKTGIAGGNLYPGASVLIRPPSEKKKEASPSVAETGYMTYSNTSTLLLSLCHLPAPKSISVKDLEEQYENTLSGDRLMRFQSTLLRFKSSYQSSYASPALVVPANIEALTISTLVSKSGSWKTSDLAQKIVLKDIFNCFDSEMLGKDSPLLRSTHGYSANIDILHPGSSIPDKFSVGEDGIFTYYGELQDIRIALLHELVHAYHYVIGSPEISRDEVRCVGLYEYKCYKYTENVFRSAVGKELRPDYPRESIPPDPEITKNPSTSPYKFSDASRHVVDAKIDRAQPPYPALGGTGKCPVCSKPIG